ncbi:MAG: AzlC family ABC transporter permease [Cyanobacteria bacterium P01_F01_bin.53]
MKRLPQHWKVPLGFWLTDESFAVAIRRYKQSDQSAYKHWYFLGAALAWVCWWR